MSTISEEPDRASSPKPDAGPSPTLVFGASGYIGTHLVPALRAQGHRVRAAARNLGVLESRAWDGVELVEADALAPDSLDAALEGVGLAYYLVHSMGAGTGFERLDRVAAEHFREAAARAGVGRIVYLGGIIPSDPDSTHLRSRLETGDILRAGAVPITEIRAGMIVGPGSAAFEVIRDLVNHLPLMLTPRWVYSRSAPIALPNLIAYLIRLPQLEESAGGVYDVGGADVLTYEELMRQYGTMVGKRPRIVPVPVLTPTLSSYWLKLVTAVPANIARALIEGLTQDVIPDDADARRLVPQTLLGFRESVEATLAAEKADTVVVRWTEGAMPCRNYHPEYAFYAKKAEASACSTAPPARLWEQVRRIGGENGYYYGTFLWRLRGLLDWLVGGPGMRRGRRHPRELRVGDAVDALRVIALEPERSVTFVFEMRTPGAGVMELSVEPRETGSRVHVAGYFHPAGVWGLLYWYALLPAHIHLFRGLTRTMARRAATATDEPG